MGNASHDQCASTRDDNKQLMDNQPSGPDGGKVGWITVLTMWTRGVVRIGIIKGLGMMLPILQDQFMTETWVFGWITSMIIAMDGIIGPFAGLIGTRFGVGAVVTACAVMISASAIAGSLTTSPLQFALILMILGGFGSGVSLVLLTEAMSRCFTTKYATASGLSRTGDGIGLILFAPLIQLFLNIYGWRGTMLLIGGISMHFIVCGALMMTTQMPQASTYEEVPQNDLQTSDHTESVSSCCSMWKIVFTKLDFRLLGNVRALSLIVIYSFTFYTQDMWIIYFVSQVESKGFSLEDAATFVTVAGAGTLMTKIFQGIIVDRGIISCWSMMVISIVITIVSYCATPWLVWYWSVMTSSVLILSGSGVVFCLVDVLIKDLIGVDRFAAAYGWMGITNAIFRFAFGFLPGLIYDKTGSYDIAFVFLGFVQLVTLLPLLGIKYFLRSK